MLGCMFANAKVHSIPVFMKVKASQKKEASGSVVTAADASCSDENPADEEQGESRPAAADAAPETPAGTGEVEEELGMPE
eukprot:9096365-Lingulodinium_polyedra.AAC.1